MVRHFWQEYFMGDAFMLGRHNIMYVILSFSFCHSFLSKFDIGYNGMTDGDNEISLLQSYVTDFSKKICRVILWPIKTLFHYIFSFKGFIINWWSLNLSFHFHWLIFTLLWKALNNYFSLCGYDTNLIASCVFNLGKGVLISILEFFFQIILLFYIKKTTEFKV